VTRVCDALADAIEANGSKRPVVTQAWHTAARLLLDKDGRSEEQVLNAIRWCQNDEFWRAVILSMPKLRQQYDRLRLAAQRATVPQRRGWGSGSARAILALYRAGEAAGEAL
jgi:hypothetical protein